MTNLRYAILASVVIASSILFPVIVLGGGLLVAISGKPLGAASNEHRRYFGGQQKDGRLWFVVHKTSGKLFDKSFKSCIGRLDLDTGEEQILDLRDIDPNLYLYAICWIDDELYFWSSAHGKAQNADDVIYKTDGTKFERVGIWNQSDTVSHSWPFPYEGMLSRIQETDEGDFSLTHLVQGEWQDGQKLDIPGFGVFWRRNQIQNRLALQVVPDRTDYHLFLRERNGIVLYHRGFPFLDETSKYASAIEPENSEPEVYGWMSIPDVRKYPDKFDIGGDDQGPFVFVHDMDQRSVWRVLGEKSAAPSRDSWPTNRTVEYYIVSGPEGYLLGLEKWNSMRCHRIAGNVIQPAHLLISGSLPAYGWRVLLAMGSVVSAWLLHLTILVWGTDRLGPKSRQTTYEFGTARAAVALTERRSIALGIDLMLLVLVVTLLTVLQLSLFRIHWSVPSFVDVCDWFFGLESGYWSYAMKEEESEIGRFQRLVFGSHATVFWEHRYWFIAIAFETFLIWSVRVYIQGRTGITPGKWLLGLRTNRDTLRPCGFARALLRDLMYWVDIPLLLTPLPAMLSIMLSQHRQRLGDRIAQTIVVDVRQQSHQ